MFRDLKSHLGLGRIGVTTSGRAARLLMALAIACWILALLAHSIPRLWHTRVCAAGSLSFLTLSLEWLRREETVSAMAYLLSLPGVGPKTAACVMLFSFGKRR
jgi:hypothetical protein